MCIKLVSIKELYYDARPTKSQDSYSVVTEFTLFSFQVQCKFRNCWTNRTQWIPYFFIYWEKVLNAFPCPQPTPSQHSSDTVSHNTQFLPMLRRRKNNLNNDNTRTQHISYVELQSLWLRSESLCRVLISFCAPWKLPMSIRICHYDSCGLYEGVCRR